MLRDEPLEVIREQYEEKNMVLGQFGEQVSAWDLYETVFGDLEQEIPVVILDEDEEKSIRVMTISDAIEFGAARNDTLLGGCTYFNNWISKKSARNIHAFIIDFDNAYSGVLLNALRRDWESANGEPFAKPTYIVNSGTGLHLYFVLSEPVPVYHSSTQNIDRLYRALAIQQSQRVYVQRQIQWFGQDFRCAGGLNKYNWENTVFRVGDTWDIDELGKAVGLEDVHFIRYGEKRQQKKGPRRKRQKIVGWKTNRAFYDYALENCRKRTEEGHRYLSMWEIRSAMKMYNERAMATPRESLEHWQGWEYKPIKRNGQKQRDHLEEARAIRDIRAKRRGEAWYANNGRPDKRAEVETWQREHPEAQRIDCARALGISRNTVAKYWAAVGTSEPKTGPIG